MLLQLPQQPKSTYNSREAGSHKGGPKAWKNWQRRGTGPGRTEVPWSQRKGQTHFVQFVRISCAIRVHGICRLFLASSPPHPAPPPSSIQSTSRLKRKKTSCHLKVMITPLNTQFLFFLVSIQYVIRIQIWNAL
jgi:hypothetical protein